MSSIRPSRLRTCMACDARYPDSEEACPSCGKSFLMQAGDDQGVASGVDMTANRALDGTEKALLGTMSATILLVFALPLVAGIVCTAAGWTTLGTILIVIGVFCFAGGLLMM